MSHPEAAEDIHPPMFETTVAIQMTVKVLWRNGAQGDDVGRKTADWAIRNKARVSSLLFSPVSSDYRYIAARAVQWPHRLTAAPSNDRTP
jgi:hypothetical protein